MKKKITYSTILFSILMVIFFLPMVQEHFSIFTFAPLNGVTQEKKIQPFTFSNYYKGTWQGSIENYISANYGFREPSIRLYNQYLWDVYKKTHSKTIVRSDDNWLFEKMFVQDYYEGLQYKFADNPEKLKTKFRNEARRLHFVQEILKEYGKTLFVMVEPGKGDIYPEHLPQNKTYLRQKNLSAVDYYPLLFDSLHINYININTWFKAIKDTASFNLYPQTGTHWSNIASAYATDSLIRYMEKLGNVNMKNISLGKPYPDKTRKPDADLDELLNLNRPIPLEKPNTYVDITTLPDSTAVKPSIIIVGDSYLWNISYQIRRFADDVMERFCNPFVDHQLTSIMLNSFPKFQTRDLPGLKTYLERKGTLPKGIVLGLAAICVYYRGDQRADGTPIQPNDDPHIMQLLKDLWEGTDVGGETANHTARRVAEGVLAAKDLIWHEHGDLNTINGLTDLLADSIQSILDCGMMEAVVNL